MPIFSAPGSSTNAIRFRSPIWTPQLTSALCWLFPTSRSWGLGRQQGWMRVPELGEYSGGCEKPGRQESGKEFLSNLAGRLHADYGFAPPVSASLAAPLCTPHPQSPHCTSPVPLKYRWSQQPALSSPQALQLLEVSQVNTSQVGLALPVLAQLQDRQPRPLPLKMLEPRAWHAGPCL